MSPSQTISSDFKQLELNALLEVTEAINSNLPEESLYKIYHFTMLADLKVKKLALFVLEENWERKVHFGIPDEVCTHISPDSYCALEVATKTSDDDVMSEHFDLVIPVKHKDRLLAIVFVGDMMDAEMGASEKSSTTFLEALTNIILVAIENKKLVRQQLEQEAYRRELEIAKQVQQFLFPRELPNNESLVIDAVYQPHQNVGGDYYDYIPIDDNKFLACIADVSGKGVPAALMMSNFQASLRTLISQSDDLELIVRELNCQLHYSGNAEIFITFFAAIYDYDKNEMQYVNCGHNPPVLTHQNGEAVLLTTGTTVLGMFDPLPFLEEGLVQDLKSFNLFAYTDGLNEAINASEEEFGEENINQVLEKNSGEDPVSINQTMLKAVEVFKGETPYRDDVTLLSVQVKP